MGEAIQSSDCFAAKSNFFSSDFPNVLGNERLLEGLCTQSGIE